MHNHELIITFEGALPADAARLAQDLEQQIREACPSAQTTLKKSREDSQDFGSTLVLLFGTPVAIALAKSVTAFLQRNSGASISITSSGAVLATNLDSRDAARIAEAFAKKN
ncbi:hypothetical protein ACVIWV_007690 [Bradyrhizobium diazoefficiens]